MSEHKLKICLLTEYFPPEPGAGSTRAYEHAKRWKALGADVTVITCMPNYPTGIIPEKYKGKTLFREEMEGIKIIRTLTFATANKGFFRRSFAYIAFMISSVIQGAFCVGKQDVLIATSPPFTVGISGLFLSKLRRFPLVFEVRDIWPESVVQLGQLKNKPVIKILEWFEVLLYKQAKMVVSVTDSYVPIIAGKGIPEEKIKIIKNGVDLDYFIPIEKDQQLCEELNLDNKFVVSYFGTFGLSHPLDKVLEAAESLKERKDIHFLFVGDGAQREKLTNIIKNKSLDNVTLLKTVSKSDLKRYYSISDLMLVPLQNIPLFKTVIPSKIHEIMAMKKPILLSVDGEARNIIEKAGSGEFVELENIESFAGSIISFADDKEKLKEYSSNGRMFVEEYFGRDDLARKYYELLKKL